MFFVKTMIHRDKQATYIALLITAVTGAHYLVSPHFGLAHNILQRLYYVPIIWSAYRFGKKGGALVSVISSLLYVPHILVTWQMHPEYQVNQMLEVLLFVIIGISAGILFERKVSDQQALQSLEKLALFGSLSRSVIRSLKAPVKSLNGMLAAMEPMARRDMGLESFVKVMKGQVKAIDIVRNDLISLVERKNILLKRHSLNQLATAFASEIDLSLRLRAIRLVTQFGRDHTSAYIASPAINDSLHHLVGIMTENLTPVTMMTIYTGESSSHVWIGISTEEVKLNSLFLSDLRCLQIDRWGDYNLMDVMNTMNNHFGDFRFRWKDGDLIEFVFVFPKKPKLPWYMKEKPVRDRSEPTEQECLPEL